MIWPPIRFSYRHASISHLPTPAPSPPTWMLTEAQCKAAAARRLKPGEPNRGCRDIEWNWLGTDDQGRDVVARLIYGFRISVLFGLMLASISSVDRRRGGRGAGLFRRLDRSPLPALHRDLVVAAAALSPDHHLVARDAELLRPARDFAAVLLGNRSCMSCAPNSCARRNFEYVNAARALGLSNAQRSCVRHVLPNAMVATLTFLPFILNSSIMTLTVARLSGLRPAAGLALARRIAAAGQVQSAGAVARPHRLLRHRADAVAARLHRRSGARRVRSEEDVSVRGIAQR